MSSRQWRLNGLVLHDSADPDTARVLDIGGWDDGAGINVLTVPNTGGHGVRAAGVWTAREKPVTLSGRLACTDRVSFDTIRGQLLGACPIGQQVELVLSDPDAGDWKRYVYRSDAATITWLNGRWAAFTLPLLAADPFRYPATEQSGVVGVFTGESWYRTYAGAAKPFTRSYVRSQLVANPSFETDLAGWDSNTALGTWSAAASLVQSTAHASDGTHSLLATWPTGAASPSDAGTWIDGLVVGQTYTFGVDVYVPAGSPDVLAQVAFGTAGAATSTKGAWARVSVTFTATATSCYLAVVTAVNANGGTCYIDNATCLPGTEDKPLSALPWTRSYAKAGPVGLPDGLQLTSDGDAVSERVTVAVHGPLTGGDWYVTNEATGDQLYVDLSLIAGQQLVLDCYAQTAMLNDNEDVTELVYGDWLTMPPGASTFRLVAGTDDGAFAAFSILPASE